MNIGLLKQTAITQLHSFITKYLSMQTMHELRSTLHSSSTIVRHFFGCLSDIFRYFRYCRRFRNDFRIFRRFHEGFSIFRRFSDRNYHFSKLRSSCAKLRSSCAKLRSSCTFQFVPPVRISLPKVKS